MEIRERVLSMIEEKQRGQKITVAPGPVIDLLLDISAFNNVSSSKKT
jgi:hypothetical protein